MYHSYVVIRSMLIVMVTGVASNNVRSVQKPVQSSLQIMDIINSAGQKQVRVFSKGIVAMETQLKAEGVTTAHGRLREVANGSTCCMEHPVTCWTVKWTLNPQRSAHAGKNPWLWTVTSLPTPTRWNGTRHFGRLQLASSGFTRQRSEDA